MLLENGRKREQLPGSSQLDYTTNVQENADSCTGLF